MKIQMTILFFVMVAWSASASSETPDLSTIAKQYESSLQTPLIPREAIIRRSERSNVTMSPNGQHLLLVNVIDRATDLTLLSVPDLEQVFTMQTDASRNVLWNADGTALVLDLGNAIAVAELPDTRPSYIARLDRAAGDYFLGPDSQSPKHILIVRKQENNFALRRINLDGEETHVLDSRHRIVDAVTTANGSRTFLKTISETGQHIAMHGSEMERTILECGPVLVDECSLDTFSAVDNTLWLRSNVHRIFTGLYAWDDNEFQLELHHVDPRSISNLWNVKYINNRPVLAQYYGEKLETYSLDDRLTNSIQVLSESHPDKSMNIHPSVGDHWLVELSASDMQKNTYHLVEIKSGDIQQIRHSKLAFSQPDLTLSEKLPFSYPANDGRILHAYVSLPRGQELEDAPLIALGHGGPLSRTYANYSSLTQLLTNRGFIVVEPNFRGSIGYGRDYLMASNKDFGNGQVQQDIDASVKYLLDLGLGDPDRVGIAGASFGGFSALSGLAFSEDLYKLGIAISAPADLTNALRHQTNATGFGIGNPSAYAGMRILINDLEDEQEVERLEKQSPLNNLSSIDKPLLIYATTGDPAVDISHVRDYAAKLVQQRTPATFFVEDGNSHGYENTSSAASIFAAIEHFLSAHFNTRSEPIDPAMRLALSQRLTLQHGPNIMGMIE
jgi:acetyl esterase/lipase